MKSLIILLFSFCFLLQTNGQTCIQGKITDGDSGEELILANVEVYQNDILKYQTYTDEFGNYKIKLDPGTYDFRVYYIGYITLLINNIVARNSQIINVNPTITTGSGICCSGPIIYEHRPPVLQYDQTIQGATYTSEDLRKY